jgi:hypothetical protein
MQSLLSRHHTLNITRHIQTIQGEAEQRTTATGKPYPSALRSRIIGDLPRTSATPESMSAVAVDGARRPAEALLCVLVLVGFEKDLEDNEENARVKR